MKLFRQRAHVVEAVEVVPTNQVELKTRFGGYTFWEAEIEDGDVILKLRISLIVGDSISVIAKEGDWLVKNASGRTQLVRQHEFPAQFEPI